MRFGVCIVQETTLISTWDTTHHGQQIFEHPFNSKSDNFYVSEESELH